MEKVYHPVTGEMAEREPVDARELRLAGWLSAPPETVAVATTTSVDVTEEARTDAEQMTVSDLKKALEAKSVEIPHGAKKADLVELFLKS